MVMQFAGTVVFSGAALAAGTTLWSAVSPQWRRILAVAAGRPDPALAPLGELVRAERRIASRRRAACQPATAWRAAA